MHTALRRCFATFLNGHGTNPLRANVTCVSTVRPTVQTVSVPVSPAHRQVHPVVPAAEPPDEHTRCLRHAAAHSATRAGLPHRRGRGRLRCRPRPETLPCPRAPDPP